MLRNVVIKNNIHHTDDIKHIIWHHGSVFFLLFVKNIVYLWVLYGLFSILSRYTVRPYLDLSFTALWVIFFIKFCVDFLNKYLDGLALTKNGINLYLREGLLEYKTEVFNRDRIETVSHSQNSFRDKIFMKWDIIITLEHGITFPFENISFPKRQASKILQLREENTLQSLQDFEDIELKENQNDKFSVLVEALGEVVKDYIDKKDKPNSPEDEYFDY